MAEQNNYASGVATRIRNNIHWSKNASRSAISQSGFDLHAHALVRLKGAYAVCMQGCSLQNRRTNPDWAPSRQEMRPVRHTTALLSMDLCRFTRIWQSSAAAEQGRARPTEIQGQKHGKSSDLQSAYTSSLRLVLFQAKAAILVPRIDSSYSSWCGCLHKYCQFSRTLRTQALTLGT